MKRTYQVFDDGLRATFELAARAKQEMEEPDVTPEALSDVAVVLGLIQGAEQLLRRAKSAYDSYLAKEDTC